MKRTNLGIGAKSLARGSTFATRSAPLHRHHRPPRPRPTVDQA